MSQPADFTLLEELIRRDPGGRGVASFRDAGELLGKGQLERAARGMAESARGVAIVTGFAVHDGQRHVAETDGPPGALVLADVLLHHGVEVALVSDAIGLPALEAGCQMLRLPAAVLHEFPFEGADESSLERQSNDVAHCSRTDAWVAGLLEGEFGRRLTHLVSIERVGPSHTLQSLLAQSRRGPPPVDDFQREVPPEQRNVCHNMRGAPINAVTAKTHRLFEIVAQRGLPITTIGIGDGGNELGMGQFPWELLRAAIAHGPAGSVACRIATELAIVAGVSNWGGYALAAAVDRLRSDTHFRRTWNAEREQQLLSTLVDTAHCVDGLTRRREPTVDGLTAAELDAFWQRLLPLA